MSDIIKRAETILMLSAAPRYRNFGDVIGVLAEMVKELKITQAEVTQLREMQQADRDFALELHDELHYLRGSTP